VTEIKFKIADLTGKEVRELPVPANRNQAGIQTVCWDMRVASLPAVAGAAGPGGGRQGGGAAGGRQGGGAGGPGGFGGAAGGPAGLPTPLPLSGSSPVNPCGGGGGFGGGGGGGFGGGGGGTQGPLVLPGTYSVSLLVDGKVVDTKPLKVVGDPGSEMTDLQRKRYYDMVMDLHEMQRRGNEVAGALSPLLASMAEIKTKLAAMSNVPADVKTQFDTLTKEFDTVRVKFGVVPPAAAPAGGGRGGGGGFGGGGAPADPANVLGRTAAVKTQIMTFSDMPGDALIRSYTDAKLALPKAIADANAFLVKAMGVSQSLKKYDLTLIVPAPVK
jgi:hypothetical protein